MTELLEKAIEEAKTVPESKQDQVAASLLEEIQRAKLFAGIERAECDVREGRLVSREEAKERMAKWLK
jgi:hypothetical protein